MIADRRAFYVRLALPILFAVFFLLPFGLRGARMSLERMENDVKDWLPDDFQETRELAWFGKHFEGQQSFVLLTWDGCSQDDPSFDLLIDKLRHEQQPTIPAANDSGTASEASALQDTKHPDQPVDSSDDAQTLVAQENKRARALGNKLGLFLTDDLRQNWGQMNEKWLQGDKQTWYYITPSGELFRWNGKSNVIDNIRRGFRRGVLGDKKVRGTSIAKLGQPSTPDNLNDFYANPDRLTALIIDSVMTGPEVMAELTEPGGPLYPIGGDYSDEGRRLEARKRAINRLTGALFGPGAYSEYDWTVQGLPAVLGEARPAKLPAGWEKKARAYLDQFIDRKLDGKRSAAKDLTPGDQDYYFNELCRTIGIEPPRVQTCIMVTLSEAATRDLPRVLGRGMLGKPQGKLVRIAVDAGVAAPPRPAISPLAKEPKLPRRVIRLGGPPVDNVAIDEEGQITLARLVGFCLVIGCGLSYLCFRSIKIMIMIFFVGGVSGVASLANVWWTGSTVDSILMTMPALVYVLGLSGAVHIVNYYREAVNEGGLKLAPERAVRHGIMPCTLAAFTTALGLMSLYNSNIIPIKKFGLFSALGVLATLVLLFTYLPSALTVWSPFRTEKRARQSNNNFLHTMVTRFWARLGQFVVRRYGWVFAACLAAMIFFGMGMPKLNTTIQLLKLFDSDAKVIQDYHWLEANLGKLVPMELVVRIDKSHIRQTSNEIDREMTQEELRNETYRYSFLERAELANQVQRDVESVFGDNGLDIVGRGMSVATFLPPLPDATSRQRVPLNRLLEGNHARLLQEDYLAYDSDHASELWRISVRLAALKDVDYGEFVRELKQVVEPILAAYQLRDELLHQVDSELENSDAPGTAIWNGGRICVLGAKPPETPIVAQRDDQNAIVVPQTAIFCNTLHRLLRTKGFRTQGPKRFLLWHDPQQRPFAEGYGTSEKWASVLQSCQSVILVDDAPGYDLAFLKQHSKNFTDARTHRYEPPAEPKHWRKSLSSFDNMIPGLKLNLTGKQAPDNTENRDGTARARGSSLQAIYTGVVPIVYKAQRTLLESLVNSIVSAFGMIAIVMTVLLLWGSWQWRNAPAGMLSMLPNIFPVIIIFGFMGHRHVLVDIGTMMCASVAMGVAVDDTIHFLAWFRHACRQGMPRKEAVLEAYRRVATAMTQTTLIAGLGLAVFALSTFTPTQRFGVMMLTLLTAALVGDLVMLPAMLASPLGRFFEPKLSSKRKQASDSASDSNPVEEPIETQAIADEADPTSSNPQMPHQTSEGRTHHKLKYRRDSGHKK